MDIFVRPGDSLWHFSEVFKIPLPLILDSNPNINPQFLRAGQRVRIPGFVTID
ncbi:LysM domain-containing protein [Lysinibacillus sp. D4B1_S16]|uniref:LysM peptidoglycan-binding domain-containing protein n=1 Tax=Lysinibacillus sp. D4B1_S16 TaxID=2941231 RepID=UPI00289F5931|nr:LysM domain-containing protein [Lysinibacillus sp. D4B1_S16]